MEFMKSRLRLSHRSLRVCDLRVCVTSTSQFMHMLVMSLSELGRANLPKPTSSMLMRGRWLNSLWARLIEHERLDESSSCCVPFVFVNELNDAESLLLVPL